QIQQLADQIAQQQQLLQQLLAAQPAPVPSPATGPLHDLPLRPHYDWHPSEQLQQLMPTLGHPVFGNALAPEERRELIERYPPVAGLNYSPPATLPEAAKHFNTGHKREDHALQDVQYASSAILRPLDVLGHILLQVLPPEQLARVFAVLHDARTLTLHVGGLANTLRNHLALRAVNPSFASDFSRQLEPRQFTMRVEDFRDALTSHATMRKAIDEARPRPPQPARRGPPAPQPSFFRGVPPLGGGGQPVSNWPPQPRQQHRQAQNRNAPRRPHPGRPSNNPYRQGLIFQQDPPLSHRSFDTRPATPDQRRLLRQEVADLLLKRAIEPADPSPGFTSPMFVIPKRSGGHRPVFNLKTLNTYLTAPHFRMETLQQVVTMLQPHDFLTSIDLSD
ncbi:hypothetical protein BCR43DRAFT_424327, partial [Syncephalastrum racemosum]